VPVSDFYPEGRNVDFGAEFHTAKVQILYLCRIK